MFNMTTKYKGYLIKKTQINFHILKKVNFLILDLNRLNNKTENDEMLMGQFEQRLNGATVSIEELAKKIGNLN